MKGGYINLELNRNINVEEMTELNYLYGETVIEYGDKLFNKIYEVLNSGKPILLTGVTITAPGFGTDFPINGYLLTINKDQEAIAMASVSYSTYGNTSVTLTVALQQFTSTIGGTEVSREYRLIITLRPN